MFKAIVILISCSILSMACNKPKKKAPAGPPCASDISLNQNVPLTTEVFKLSREYATVRRFACDGSQKVTRETVKDPKDAYTISAKTLPAGDYEVRAQNRTNCSTGRIKPRANGDLRMEIQMHTSPGTRRMHVEKNADNYIDYEFSRCLERGAGGKCLRSEVAERGTVLLKVEYTEVEKPGETHTRDTCKP